MYGSFQTVSCKHFEGIVLIRRFYLESSTFEAILSRRRLIVILFRTRFVAADVTRFPNCVAQVFSARLEIHQKDAVSIDPNHMIQFLRQRKASGKVA